MKPRRVRSEEDGFVQAFHFHCLVLSDFLAMDDEPEASIDAWLGLTPEPCPSPQPSPLRSDRD